MNSLYQFCNALTDFLASIMLVSETTGHLIPRRIGDIDDPSGGIRGVIPEKQKYSTA
jgi:hypothetical protein